MHILYVEAIIIAKMNYDKYLKKGEYLSATTPTPFLPSKVIYHLEW